jgi:hypothetical protein
VPGPERHSRRRLGRIVASYRARKPSQALGLPGQSRYLRCRKGDRASRISLVRVIALPPFFMSPPGAGRYRAIAVRSWSVPQVRFAMVLTPGEENQHDDKRCDSRTK